MTRGKRAWWAIANGSAVHTATPCCTACEFVACPGSAADYIAVAAQKGRFDLIMMGSHGQGSLANLVMGSVATKGIAHCKTPVLLIR